MAVDRTLKSHQKSLHKFLNERSEKADDVHLLSPYGSNADNVMTTTNHKTINKGGQREMQHKTIQMNTRGTFKKKQKQDLLMKDYCSRSLSNSKNNDTLIMLQDEGDFLGYAAYPQPLNEQI